MTHRELFQMRLRREGRWEDYEKIVRHFKAEGSTPVQAHRLASEHMGRRSRKDERQLYINELAREAYAIRKGQIANDEAVVRTKKADCRYQDALKGLPPTASAEVELDWVRAHPRIAAISRANTKGKTCKVLVSVSDILKPPHGRAPSMAAVHMLQHWCNHADDFFSKMLMEQRKGTPKKGGRPKESMEDDDTESPPEDDTSDLDALLGS